MGNKLLKLRYNFGFMLEAPLGTSRTMEIAYPKIHVAEDLLLAPLEGTFTATRTSEGVYIGGVFHSQMTVPCVRCLEEAVVPLTIELDELFYYPPDSAADGEYTIGENGFLDLGPLVREQTFLALPMQPLCEEECLGLCLECGQNLNEGDCGCQPDDIDPRLAILRGLLD